MLAAASRCVMVVTLLIVKACGRIGQLTALVYHSHHVTSVSIKYNRIVRVELFLNFAWAMLSVTLSLLWIKRLRVSVHSKQPDVKVQLLALAMLIIILLPVISMTDDMQAISAAEIEHVTRRADLLPNLDHARDLVALLDARLFPNSHLLNLQVFARVELFSGSEGPQYRSIRQMAKRPPPTLAA
ncbi:hypothetical protein H7849_05410 [Alloacidobacterium dinghuense]|uniref:Uncharacterized protein n=1 Tax=Alloacidobacterium dinghuense TaxID=2763107 RepID=A0A7G8BLH2_9BACT|nr:hypothetical protein [Alloacidobacterium dinghuense]QNI33392.1 hypothetical protein H7849_05410 [Alloacidobacterium dinghuense]